MMHEFVTYADGTLVVSSDIWEKEKEKNLQTKWVLQLVVLK